MSCYRCESDHGVYCCRLLQDVVSLCCELCQQCCVSNVVGLSYGLTIRFQELDIRRGLDPFMLLILFHTADADVCGFINVMQFLHDCYFFSLIILRKLARFLLNSVRFSFVECCSVESVMTLLHGDFTFFVPPRYRSFPDFFVVQEFQRIYLRLRL